MSWHTASTVQTRGHRCDSSYKPQVQFIHNCKDVAGWAASAIDYVRVSRPGRQLDTWWELNIQTKSDVLRWPSRWKWLTYTTHSWYNWTHFYHVNKRNVCPRTREVQPPQLFTLSEHRVVQHSEDVDFPHPEKNRYNKYNQCVWKLVKTSLSTFTRSVFSRLLLVQLIFPRFLLSFETFINLRHQPDLTTKRFPNFNALKNIFSNSSATPSSE